MSTSLPQPSTGWGDQRWERRVTLEAQRQAAIEAAFDNAEECERLGYFERALEWLDQASALGGGLSPAGLEQQERLTRETAGRSR